MKKQLAPWIWVPTLYFAEGLPYFIVNNISALIFVKMGMGNAEMALHTSLLYLPWLIKPFWSPFVDILKTKRWWVVVMELLLTACFLLTAFSIPSLSKETISAGEVPATTFRITLAIFWITAFASATHDIAADGFYMLGLSGKEQSLFVGIRSTFYRIASLFVLGALVVFAGILELRFDSIPLSWKFALLLIAIIFGAISLLHLFLLPKPSDDKPRNTAAKEILKDFGNTFATFFKKPLAWYGIAFMLLYRLPEAFTLKIVPAFLVDSTEHGGLALSTVNYGLINNTIGVIGLVTGGIFGGWLISRAGLKKSLWSMGLSLALPCGAYLAMSLMHTVPLWLIGTFVAIEQFGYGFGFTAYMMYMILVSEGEFKTSHYSLCTAFMAASIMLPGLFAGALQEAMGYSGYFIFVMVSCLATVAAVLIARHGLDPEYGKK